MKFLLALVRPEFIIWVAQYDEKEGKPVSVGLLGEPLVVFHRDGGERTINEGYWQVTGKIADYIAHAAHRANRYPRDIEINDFLRVLGYYLPIEEEIVTIADAETKTSACGDKNWQVATRYHCEWFEEVLHKIGAHCRAYYMSDVPRLVLETVKEAQEEIERRKGVLSPNPPIKPILAPRSIPHPRSMENVLR
jgi:hypothetical protein